MRLLIKRLYGIFNYELDFKDDITILTGPNGFGKSTILRCIEAFSNSDVQFFAKLDFEKIVLYSDSSASVEIEKDENALRINGHLYKDINKRLPYRGNRYVNVQLEDEYNDSKYLQDLQLMTKVAGNIKMIEEQRLLEEKIYNRIINGQRLVLKELKKTIDEMPEQLYTQIDFVANSYSKVATKLDSSFPYRLLNAKDIDVIDAQQFSELYDDMNRKLEILTRNGISIINSQGDLKFKEEDAKVLKIFFDDFNKKYNEYSPLMDKMTLFQEIVNRRLKFKRLQFSEGRKLSIVEKRTGKRILLNALSSGEKEILILFYSLIFKTEKGMLILIDEPEISLHIEWQMMFISDLKKIVKMNDLHAIVATHSADIIGGHRDIQIDLGELYQNGQYQTSTE